MRWNLRQLFQLSPPKGDVYYGDNAELYDAERAHTKRWAREQAAVKDYLDRLPKGLKILDVPLGTGRYLPFYFERGDSVVGLDSSHAMIDVARRRAGDKADTLETVVGDATNLPFEDGAFDLVVSTRFLRHILPFSLARKSLAEMARVTRSHAIIELGCNDWRSHFVSESKPPRDRMSYADTVKLLESHGFRIEAETVTIERFYRKRRIVFLLRKIGA